MQQRTEGVTMPKAAFCSQCGENVYLTEDGRCPKGHGPESLSNYYDAPSPEPVAQGPVEEPVPAAVPGTPAPGGPPPGAPAKKSNKTLIIVLAVVAVLLLCACAFIFGGLSWFGSALSDLEEEGEVIVDVEDMTTEDDLDLAYPDVESELVSMVEHFYPEFTLSDYVEATEPGDSVDYHIIVDSAEVPGFYMTFFATRSTDLNAEGADDPEIAFATGDAVWLHPQTKDSGLYSFAGPDAIVYGSMREQIMTDFLAARDETLFMTEHNFTNNVELGLRGIREEDLDPWYEDFNTWESTWKSNLQEGVWEETSFEYLEM
jgi:hypothetical protein